MLLFGLSNKVLCILAAQGAAKIPEVKIGDTRKKCRTLIQTART